MLTIYILIAVAFIVATMAVRITENPIRVARWNVVEGGANTFAESELQLPTGVLKNKVQAIEMMKVVSGLDLPSVEAAQGNATFAHLSRDSQTTITNLDDDQCLFRREWRHTATEVTAVGEMLWIAELVEVTDLTDGDGRGEILLERSIFAGVLGSGNSSAKRFAGYMLGHIVEVSGEEAAVIQFAAD